MRLQGTFDLSRCTPHERHDRTFIARRTHRNRKPPFGTHEHKNHPNLRQNHRPKDKPRHGNPVAQVGGYGEEYLPSHLIKNRIPMKEERNIITMDGQGNIFLPNDIGATAMTEWEICELFGVIAPTVRAGIKALCKSGVLSIYDIKRIIRLSDRYSAEVYNLETIAALAFRIESFGAARFVFICSILNIQSQEIPSMVLEKQFRPMVSCCMRVHWNLCILRQRKRCVLRLV